MPELVKTFTETKIKTNPAVKIGVVLSMLGALAAGYGFYAAITGPQSLSIVSDTEPVTRQPYRVSDLTNVMLSAGLPTEETGRLDHIELLGYRGTNEPLLFGTFDTNVAYQDGSASSTALPLMVRIVSTSRAHQPFVFSAIKSGLQNNRFNFCVPQKDLRLAALQNEKGILGIPTAQAVEVNTNSSGLFINHTYFVDSKFDVYYDSKLTRPVDSSLSCLNMISKSFAPNDITNIRSSQPIYADASNWLYFFKQWSTVLGAYNSTEGFINIAEDTTFFSESPLLIYGRNSYETPLSIPEMNIDVTFLDEEIFTPQTKSLCLPDQVLENNEFFVFWYDNDGHPYSDIMLQNQIACGTQNSCASVNCVKDPSSPCCVVKDENIIE